MGREALPLLQPEWIELGDGEETPARFKVRPLTGGEAIELIDLLNGNKITGKACRRACEIAIVDYENYLIDGKHPRWRPALIDRLRWEEIQAIGMEIIDRSYNSGDQAGN